LTATKAEQIAPLGRYGCDTPMVLLEKMLSIIRYENPILDVLFIPGDIAGHGYPTSIQKGTKDKYDKLLEVHRIAAQTIR
jgi:hypothetical protein